MIHGRLRERSFGRARAIISRRGVRHLTVFAPRVGIATRKSGIRRRRARGSEATHELSVLASRFGRVHRSGVDTVWVFAETFVDAFPKFGLVGPRDATRVWRKEQRLRPRRARGADRLRGERIARRRAARRSKTTIRIVKRFLRRREGKVTGRATRRVEIGEARRGGRRGANEDVDRRRLAIGGRRLAIGGRRLLRRRFPVWHSRAAARVFARRVHTTCRRSIRRSNVGHVSDARVHCVGESIGESARGPRDASRLVEPDR